MLIPQNQNEPADAVNKTAGSILDQLCELAFKGDVAATALALGRDAKTIEQIMAGDAAIDEDLDMKIHGIAQQRNVSLD